MVPQGRRATDFFCLIYYTSSGTLYVASEDGKYLQELDKNVSYTTAQDGKYLYYLRDDRNDTYPAAEDAMGMSA